MNSTVHIAIKPAFLLDGKRVRRRCKKLGARGELAVKKNTPKIVTAVMTIYFIFFMNLGTRTFAQHVLRIATTPEAHDLTYEIFETGREAVNAVATRARNVITGFTKFN